MYRGRIEILARDRQTIDEVEAELEADGVSWRGRLFVSEDAALTGWAGMAIARFPDGTELEAVISPATDTGGPQRTCVIIGRGTLPAGA